MRTSLLQGHAASAETFIRIALFLDDCNRYPIVARRHGIDPRPLPTANIKKAKGLEWVASRPYREI